MTAKKSGAMEPNKVGPNKTPAIISPTTAGCLKYFAIAPKEWHATNIVMIAIVVCINSSRLFSN